MTINLFDLTVSWTNATLTPTVEGIFRQKIIYSDISPVFHPNIVGNLKVVKNKNSVEASIENILLTPLYTRIMLPEFASNLERFLFEPISELTSFKIRSEALRAITKWDNRINISDIEVNPLYEENAYHIQFQYYVEGMEDIASFDRVLRA